MTSDLDKLRKLLPHWLEHNAEHAEEFRQWAERARALGASDAAASIIHAAEAMEKANAHLAAAQVALA
ncbi:MAG: hypothetical protein ACUVWR_03560 [Anaerolineae bacterium]